MADVPYTLHAWPAKWSLQSLDPTCLAAVMYLQLTIPGKFKVSPCSNPDQSPNGQLPFLTYAHTAVSTFPSIVSFVSSLAKSNASDVKDLDASLTTRQKAERAPRYAHVETYVSDLVAHFFYGNNDNFWGLTSPALASDMPIPQRYYVARRIREAYRPRLEAAGLWNTRSTEEEPKGQDKKKEQDYKTEFTRAFEREKIFDKAKTALGIHANYLDGKPFFFGDRPTSLDVYFAAHILLMAEPPFPDVILQTQLLEFYPGLIEHARRMQAEVARAPPYELVTVPGFSLGSLLPRPFSRSSGTQTQVDHAAIEHRRKTLIFIVAAAAMAAVYYYMHFLHDDHGDEVGDHEEETDASTDEAFAEDEE